MSSKNKAKAEKPEVEAIENPSLETVEGDTLADEPVEEETTDIESSVRPQPADLHGCLTKAVRAISTTGGQEKVFALHQIELLTGRLKMAVPAAIAATEDEDLKAGLEALLALL